MSEEITTMEGGKPARTLEQVREAAAAGELEQILTPVDAVFAGLPEIVLEPALDALAHNGNPLPHPAGGEARVYDSQHRFIGVFRGGESLLRPVKMFYDPES